MSSLWSWHNIVLYHSLSLLTINAWYLICLIPPYPAWFLGYHILHLLSYLSLCALTILFSCLFHLCDFFFSLLPSFCHGESVWLVSLFSILNWQLFRPMICIILTPLGSWEWFGPSMLASTRSLDGPHFSFEFSLNSGHSIWWVHKISLLPLNIRLAVI